MCCAYRGSVRQQRGSARHHPPEHQWPCSCHLSNTALRKKTPCSACPREILDLSVLLVSSRRRYPTTLTPFPRWRCLQSATSCLPTHHCHANMTQALLWLMTPARSTLLFVYPRCSCRKVYPGRLENTEEVMVHISCLYIGICP